MILPDVRTLLVDALTPPPGCTFDSGIATSYSLDLVTLLTIPLHLSWMGDDRAMLDPLPVIEALRRTADRLTVVYERGRLQVPRSASPLLGLLEGVVHEAAARHGGAFHPKVWLLRFAGETEGEPTRMRLLVLSRNLTDDRSWDISVCLDGMVGRKPQPRNKPLGVFLEQVRASAQKPLTAQRSEDLARLAHDLARCEWELPGRFEDMRFHALGVGRRPESWLPRPEVGRWDELGVVSPFVTAGALRQLSALTEKPLFLLSRPEELDRLATPGVDMFERAWVLDERAEYSDEEEDVRGRLQGLHAKVYVGRRGWDTHLFLGSANASDAALTAGLNTEFMVELVGKASKVGRPETWESKDGLLPLLRTYEPSPPPDPETLQEERDLEELRTRLSSAALRLACQPADGAWEMQLHGLNQVDLGEAAVGVWPVTLHSDRAVAVPPRSPPSLSLGSMAAQDVTSFTAFSLRIGNSEVAFALDLPLDGAPPARDLEILKAALRNRDGFVRYLMLLLGDWEPLTTPTDDAGRSATPWRAAPQDSVPIFEMLTRTFARDPQRLTHVAQLVERLRQDDRDGADSILPPEFLAIWQCFEQAMAQHVEP